MIEINIFVGELTFRSFRTANSVANNEIFNNNWLYARFRYFHHHTYWNNSNGQAVLHSWNCRQRFNQTCSNEDQISLNCSEDQIALLANVFIRSKYNIGVDSNGDFLHDEMTGLKYRAPL